MTCPTYPFTPKGCTKIFSSASEFKPVTGILDHLAFKYTPYYLSLKYPFLFDNRKKYILPIQFDSEKELFAACKEFQQEIENNFFETLKPTDFLIQRIEHSKSGNGMEPFMEYLACEYFKRKGFIVENQIPLSATIGSPDFGGYHISFDGLSLEGIHYNGLHIIELALMRIDNRIKLNHARIKNTQIVGEAKTATTQMEKQLSKYTKTGLFKQAYEIHPEKTAASNDCFGLLRINQDFEIEVAPSNLNSHSFACKLKIDKYEKWLSIYLKFYMLANLTNNEAAVLAEKRRISLNTIDSYVTLLEKVKIDELYHEILEVI